MLHRVVRGVRDLVVTCSVVAGVACGVLAPAAPAQGQPLGASPPPVRAARDPRPNVVLILADDLARGDLGCYGQRVIQTPRLDALAAEGVRFTAFYGESWCWTARAALLSGRHSGHLYRDALDDHHVVAPATRLLPELLADGGYRCAMFGKWGLSGFLPGPAGAPTRGLPQELGFEAFAGFLTHRDAHVAFHDAPPRGTGPWFPPPPVGPRQHLWRLASGTLVPYHVAPDRFLHDEFVDAALDFLRASASDRTRPFFLYLPFTLPHAELVLPKHDEAWQAYFDATGQARIPERPFAGSRLYPRGNPMPRTTYAALVTRLDRDVGRILDALRELALEQDTVVLVTGDNGPHDEGGLARGREPAFSFHSAAGLRGGKFSLWEGGLRVPMLVRWPGCTARGHVDTAPAWMPDLLPTLAEITGTPVPHAVDGMSLLHRLRGVRDERRRALYWEDARASGTGPGQPVQAVRDGRFKLVRIDAAGGDRLALYDLDANPQESVDLAARPELASTVVALARIMDASHVPPPIATGWWMRKIEPLRLPAVAPSLTLEVLPHATTLAVMHYPLDEIDWRSLSLRIGGVEAWPALLALVGSAGVDVRLDACGELRVQIAWDLTGTSVELSACTRAGRCTRVVR